MRTVVRDAHGKARVAYVRVSDKRILYPRVVQQVTRLGGKVELRSAVTSGYRPSGYAGYGVYRRDYGHGVYGVPGRQYYPVNPGYSGTYRPSGNYGVDAILYRGNRSPHGSAGYGRVGGAIPRPVVRPNLPGLPLPRYSGNVKGH